MIFFNLPVATRLILLGWATVPQERLRLAQHLALSPSARFRLIEFPMLANIIPSAFVVIFVICLSSFSVAFALDGGPKSTTLELAIYQAFRFDFDLQSSTFRTYTIEPFAKRCLFRIRTGAWGSIRYWL